jgi:hypothetical protein
LRVSLDLVGCFYELTRFAIKHTPLVMQLERYVSLLTSFLHVCPLISVELAGPLDLENQPGALNKVDFVRWYL